MAVAELSAGRFRSHFEMRYHVVATMGDRPSRPACNRHHGDRDQKTTSDNSHADVGFLLN